MAKRILIAVIVILLLIRLTALPMQKAINHAWNPDVSYHKGVNRALDAALTITLYGYIPDQVDAAGISTPTAKPSWKEGLGTLIVYEDRHLIVTHDHWRNLNPELDLVQFRNARQELVAQVRGDEFHQLILYRDGGTMILMAPERLRGAVTAVSWNEPPAFSPGMVVTVVHRSQGAAGGVATMTATVEQIESIRGVPSLCMRSQNGHVIQPGDSGGGIWVEGNLAGNMWMALTVNVLPARGDGSEQEVRMEQNWSQAAVLTEEILSELVLV